MFVAIGMPSDANSRDPDISHAERSGIAYEIALVQFAY